MVNVAKDPQGFSLILRCTVYEVILSCPFRISVFISWGSTSLSKKSITEPVTHLTGDLLKNQENTVTQILLM